MKILFLGSSHFSKIVLEELIKKGVNISAVITQPDKPAGRGHKLTPTEVNIFAKENGIDVFTFPKVRDYIEEISKLNYDVALVASFGQILPQAFLDLKLTINVHPSLLPKYRGATPIQSAILNGDEITGVTIMKVAKEVDSGDIILQQQVQINEEYYCELEEKLATIGGNMACEVIDSIEKGTIKFTPQDHSKAVLVSKLTKEDGKLDFSKTANEIVNIVRALSEEIGCYLSIDDKSIKIGRVKNVSNEFSVGEKSILNNKKRFVVGCSDGAIEILTCQAPSGKMITGRDFLNGHNEILGEKVD